MAQDHIRRLGSKRARCVETDPSFAPSYTQQATVMHGVHKMRGRVGRSAPIVGHLAVREMLVYLARMHYASFGDELQQHLVPFLRCGKCRGPGSKAAQRDAFTGARMHQRLQLRRYEPIGDKKFFLHAQLRIVAASTISLHFR